jgi:DNA invertase Pin-like site-specific DNA recombinase
MQKQPRDVVVVRVSEQGDRDEESFHSPKPQLAKAKFWSEDQGHRVVDAFEEIDVSGKLPLARRPGLLKAIEMVEAGEADHIVVAYFDRLVRSLKVQLEVIERVERAGGEIYAIDHGRLTNGTAATRMSNNMMGAAFQYYAEVTGEKVAAARERVVARGVLPNSRISPGYVRGEDGVLVVERPKARIVVQAFRRRDRGASLVEIQAFLAKNGIERSISGVESMLRSRMYLGEIHFGVLHNLHAHEPIVKDRALFGAGAAADGLAGASGQVCAAAGAPGCAAVRVVRVADGDQQLHRQLPVRRHEREPVPAASGGQGRPGRRDGVGRRPGVLGHGRRAPTRFAPAADPRGGRGDRARQRGSR